MSAHRNSRNISALNKPANLHGGKRRIKTTKSQQAGNMRLVGSLIAFALLIFAAILIALMFLFKTIGGGSTDAAIVYSVFIGVSYVFLALFWRTLFHAGGEHLDKMDMLTNQNNRLIEKLTMITEQNEALLSLKSDKHDVEIYNNDKKPIYQGKCPFCDYLITFTEHGIHTCSNCGNKFQT